MKKRLIFSACCLVALFVAGAAFAQQGGNTAVPQGQGFTGPGAAVQGQFGGFTGPTTIVTAAQVAMLPNKSPVAMRGNIVQQISHDRYIFRDSTGDITIKVKPERWWGLTVGPSDVVEIYGDFKRDKRNWQFVHVDVKMLRKP